MSLENRKRINEKLVGDTLVQLGRRISEKIRQRGNHSFVSRHEILGQVTEKYNELIDAIKLDRTPHMRHTRDELFDIATACMWGVLSIDTNSVDW